MVTGSMDDISQEGSAGAESQESEERDSMSTQGQRAIYAREANIQVDYDNLEDELKEVGHIRFMLYFFFAAHIAQVAWPVQWKWARQLKQFGQQ